LCKLIWIEEVEAAKAQCISHSLKTNNPFQNPGTPKLTGTRTNCA
jgi:hypothetical protein